MSRLKDAVADIHGGVGDFYANDFAGFIEFGRYMGREFDAPGFITFAGCMAEQQSVRIATRPNEYMEDILVTDAYASNERSE